MWPRPPRPPRAPDDAFWTGARWALLLSAPFWAAVVWGLWR